MSLEERKEKLLAYLKEHKEKFATYEKWLDEYFLHARRMKITTVEEMLSESDLTSIDWLEKNQTPPELPPFPEEYLPTTETLSNKSLPERDQHPQHIATQIWETENGHIPSYERVASSFLVRFLVTLPKDLEEQLEGNTREDMSTFKGNILRLRLAPYCLVLAHLKILNSHKHPTPNHQTIAEYAIQTSAQREPTAKEVDALARELLDRMKEAAGVINLEGATLRDLINLPEKDGMLLWDSRAAAYFEKFGAFGKEQARSLREKSKEQWVSYQQAPTTTHNPPRYAFEEPVTVATSLVWSVCWNHNREGLPTPLKFAWVLAKILWVDVVEKRINHASTLPLEIGKALLSTYGRRDAELSRNKSQLLCNGEVIATVPALDARHFAHINQKALGSLDMAKAIPWIVRKSWQQQGAPNDADINIEGGLRGFAETVLHLKGNSALERARQVLNAGRDFQRTWPGGFNTSGLWTFTYREPSRTHHAELTITTSPVLRPHSQMGRKMLGSMLSPVIDPPPLTGRPNEHAPQAFFANLLMLQLVEHRKELPFGGALISRERLERLACEVDLPLSTLYKALDRWTQDGDDGEAFLVIEGDPKKAARYMLADNDKYKAERNFLLKGAERSALATEAAKKSIETKLDNISGKHKKA